MLFDKWTPTLTQVTGPLASTTEYEELPGPVPPADASEEDLAALQAQTWSAASLSVAGIRVQGVKGQVGGYSSSSFVVEFTPRVAGELDYAAQFQKMYRDVPTGRPG